MARARFSSPSAATVHCGEVMSSMETKVGSPPIVRSRPRSAMILSTDWPTSCRWLTRSGVYGLVTRGSSENRVTVLENSNSTVVGSVAPPIGAAWLGCGVAAKGM